MITREVVYPIIRDEVEALLDHWRAIPADDRPDLAVTIAEWVTGVTVTLAARMDEKTRKRRSQG